MNNHAWDEGMALMEANLRDSDKTPAMKALRGQTIRARLGHLTDEQWGAIVQMAICKPDGWFPVLGELEAFVASLPPSTMAIFEPADDGVRVRRVLVAAPPPDVQALPAPERTPEERRADAVRLLDAVKAAVVEREKDLPPTPIVTAPRETCVVVASDERLDALRRQAKEIGGATAVAVAEIERA